MFLKNKHKSAYMQFANSLLGKYLNINIEKLISTNIYILNVYTLEIVVKIFKGKTWFEYLIHNSWHLVRTLRLLQKQIFQNLSIYHRRFTFLNCSFQF